MGVFGCDPHKYSRETLPRVGFLAQDHPLYKHFTVGDLLTMGRKMNPRWEQRMAEERLAMLDIPLGQRAGKLSGGQQAQVALALALAKRPDLMLLDEPLASIDPLARRNFLRVLMGETAEHGLTVLLSSHIIGDLERVCDYLIILSDAHVQLAGDIDEIIRTHKRLIGPRTLTAAVARIHDVIEERHSERQTTLLVRINGHLFDPSWEMHDVTLEEIVLAYMAFALALGVAAGAITRHTIPAMVATLIGYLGVRDVIANLVRPYYLPPYSSGTFDPYVTTPKTLPGNQDWITAVTWTDHAGHFISNNQIGQACNAPVPTLGIPLPLRIPLPLNFPRSFNCTSAHGWLQTITWQPVDRAWLFQGIESAIFFGLAAGLLALAYWWIRERIS